MAIFVDKMTDLVFVWNDVKVNEGGGPKKEPNYVAY